MVCTHLADNISQPGSRSVFKDECTKCFDNWDGADGVRVCLKCFNGGCLKQGHAKSHASMHSHPIALQLNRTEKIVSEEEKSTAAKTAAALAIAATKKEYEYSTKLICYECDAEGAEIAESEVAQPVIEAVLQANAGTQAEEVKAWEAEKLAPCPHTLDFAEQQPRVLDANGLATCESCDINENLWLCLTCGALGCGRRAYDGSGGNNHAIDHSASTGHAVVVKMGTITPEGKADIHCYSCDSVAAFNYGDVVDPCLTEHLASFGIQVSQQVKTAASMAELELQLNASFDFSMVLEGGAQLAPLYGGGATGLVNLGNSCYMNSVVQCLFSTPRFRQRYGAEVGAAHLASCRASNTAECVQCQLAKLADGLLSGRYSLAPTEEELAALTAEAKAAKAKASAAAAAKQGEEGGEGKEEEAPVPTPERAVCPRMFKNLVGKGHADFSGGKQQDADEYLHHLLTVLSRDERRAPGGGDPATALQFKVEERLQCTNCQGVRYKTVDQEGISLSIPFDPATQPEASDADADAAEADAAEAKAGAAGDKKKGEKEPGIGAGVTVPFTDLLSRFASTETLSGVQCTTCGGPQNFTLKRSFASFPDTLVVQVQRFGFFGSWVPQKLLCDVTIPEVVDLQSYLGTGLQASETTLAEPAAPKPEVDEAIVAQLMAMGFPRNRCERAAHATGNSNADAAMNWLFAHMDDADIDEPLVAAGGGGDAAAEGPAVDEAALVQLLSMGFSDAKCRRALRETDNSADRAMEWIFSHMDEPDEPEPAAAAAAPAAAAADGKQEEEEPDTRDPKYRLTSFVAHRGTSTACGHYVAFLRRGAAVGEAAAAAAADGGSADDWVIFNDRKVAVHPTAPVSTAYLLFFSKQG